MTSHKSATLSLVKKDESREHHGVIVVLPGNTL